MSRLNHEPRPETWRAQRAQLDSLTGLRILAAVWVMLHHFRDVTPTQTWKFPLIDRFILQGGRFGVDLFFVLSGFILSHVYFKQFNREITRANFRSFIALRFARLYPVHIATFLAMVALFAGASLLGGTRVDPDRYSLGAFISTLTMTHAWWGETTTPNIPAWSISAEWFVYLFFPIVCLIISRLRFAPLVLVVAGCGLATVWQEVSDHPLIRVMAGFLVGMAAYQASRYSTALARVPGLGIAIVGLIVAWATIGASPRLEIGLLLFAVLIITLSSERDWLCSVLSLTAVVYLGEVSYAVYMVHWVVRVVVREAAERSGALKAVPLGFVVATYVAVTMFAAILLYHFVERPWRRRLRRILARRAAVHPDSDRLPHPSIVTHVPD